MKTTRHDEATYAKADKRNEKRERKRCLMIFCCVLLVVFVIVAITIALIFVLLINKENDPKANGVTCKTGWIARNGSRSCYLFSNDKKDWTGAQSECLKRNGSLTDVETSNELTFVNHQVEIRTLDY
ncbi:C-type lectin domain family 2 member H-like [Mytilus edulis]|uniref:C-type lectin domain family 2 member H-like n=1 Tax=Mytilus edulis TaxID=6550 RepID=UPI0039EF30C1